MADHTFRLLHTPLGTVLVKFYRVVPFTAASFERCLAADFWTTTQPGSTSGSWKLARYQGLLAQNPILPAAVAQLAKQCPECNCVRIE